MTQRQKQYIEQNRNLIEDNRWKEFFKNAPIGVGQLLYEAGVNFLEYVSEISSIMFRYSDLTELVIPNNITSIEKSAFEYCHSLKSVTIGKRVTHIGSAAFHQCTSLTSITIPDSVTSIKDHVFFRCTNLKSVVIGNGVTNIERYAFEDCKSLTSVTIGNSVTEIGSDAFKDCTSLTSVYITDIAAWCKISFEDSSSNPLYNGGNLYLNGVLVTNLVIPNNVTSIGDFAFPGYSNLTSIVVPNSVTSIGEGAFNNLDSDVVINFDGTKEQWKNIYNSRAFKNTYFTVNCLDGTLHKKKR